MFKVSALILLVGACVVSAGLLSRKPTISSEFKKINDWLVDNLPENKDGYANVRKAAEYLATQKSSMEPKEQQAWELFTSLSSLENECTVEAAKVVHRNFDEAALEYPEGRAALRIEIVLKDIQDKRLEVCEKPYYRLVVDNEPPIAKGDPIGLFGMFWQRIVAKMDYPAAYKIPETEKRRFGDKFERVGERTIAKLIYESIGSARQVDAMKLVYPGRDEKTGRVGYPSEQAAQSFVKVFYDECNRLISSLGDKIDLMMSPKDHWILRMYRRVELCKRLTATYKPDRVAKELVKISKHDFELTRW